MKRNVIFSILLGAGLTACSSYFVATSYTTNTTPVDATKQKSEWVENYVQPYKDSLDIEMNTRIASTPIDLLVERPNGTLNNWVADATVAYMKSHFQLEEPILCILNTGGIRANLNKGEVTLGHIFKIMPFDNEVVYLKMPMTVLPEIEAYLRKSGGEPLGNGYLDEVGLHFNEKTEATHFTLITSDFLAAGGDKMVFMKKNLSLTDTGVLLRDALTEIAKKQETLKIDTTNRIKL